MNGSSSFFLGITLIGFLMLGLQACTDTSPLEINVNVEMGLYGPTRIETSLGVTEYAIRGAKEEKAVEIIFSEVGRIFRLLDAQGVVHLESLDRFTEDGTRITARAIAGNVHPQTLLTRMLDPNLLPPDTRRRIDAYRSHSATFRMNVALSELPRFASLATQSNELFGGAIEICPSLGYMRQAYSDALAQGWSKAPIISFWLPTTQDDTLAPPGGHVASLFCQHFQRHLPGGQSWDEVKEDVADLVINTVDQYAPNFSASILGRQIKSPLDIERDLGMVGGDIFHGALHLDQLFSLRPIVGHADYRMPA